MEFDLHEMESQVSNGGFAVGFDARVAIHDTAAMTDIAALFGEPSERDNGPLWPVVPRGVHGTISTRSGAADLHTDAQYRRDPERLFVLFCVRPARRGGDSIVLRVDDFWDDLPDAIDPTELGLLRDRLWSWTTPAEFADEVDTHRHPVLTPARTVRWRRDNLLTPSEQLAAAADRFHGFVNGHPDRLTISLRPGQFLVCDNQRVLHGRTHFDDTQRLLLRTRLNTR